MLTVYIIRLTQGSEIVFIDFEKGTVTIEGKKYKMEDMNGAQLDEIIAGLEKPSGGQVTILSKNNRSDIGYMLQQDHLFPWLTVRQNALLGLDIRKEKTKEVRKRI